MLAADREPVPDAAALTDLRGAKVIHPERPCAAAALLYRRPATLLGEDIEFEVFKASGTSKQVASCSAARFNTVNLLSVL